MSDHHEEENLPKGKEWEVVALTDSTYAASPCPKEGMIADSSIVGLENPETARAMFMSGHFGSPSKQEHSDTLKSKKEDDINMEGVVYDGDEKVIRKGENISLYSSGDVAPSNSVETEPTMYDKTGEAGESRITEPVESLDRSETSETSDMMKQCEEDEFSNLPHHETWWRKHAASLYAHTKNVNPVWSFLVAAAVVGLVIVGYRWQREKKQIMQVKPRLALDGERSRWVHGPVKDATLVGRNSLYVGVLSAAER